MLYEKRICPGVRLVNVKTNSFKTNQISISLAVPLDDNAAKNALLIGLLKRSCARYPNFSNLVGKLDDLHGAMLGAGVSKIGDAQVVNMHITCLDDKFSLDGESIVDESARLLFDMLFEPNVKRKSFGRENLALEKRLLINRILEEQDDKKAYARKKLIEYMCENEPYGKSCDGTIEQVKKVTLPQVYEAWKNLLSTAIVQVTVVGGSNIENIEKIVADKFSIIERHPCKIKQIFISKAKNFERIEETVPVNQGKLVLGYRTGMKNCDDNLFATRVMCDILGGGTYSKLFTNVREKMSLAYYCNSSLISSKGIIIIQSGIDTHQEKTATKVIIQQLEDITQGNFEDETLAASKRSLREGFTYTAPESYTSWYEGQILDEKLSTPEEYAKSLEGVSREEVCNAAKRMSIDKVFMLKAEQSEEGENED